MIDDPRAVNFYDLKSLAFASLGSNAKLVYHYAVFGHLSICDSDAHCAACSLQNPDGSEKTSQPVYGQSGIAEISGNDFIVSLGSLRDDGDTFDPIIVGGTFMHELGHNLGLRHGGGNEDAPGFKPNYLSVMNYRYQFVGIRSADLVGSAIADDSLTRIDYSTQVLPTGGNTPGALDESNLDETAGLGSGTADLFSFMNGNCMGRLAASNGPVDFDGDGSLSNPAYATDLNPQEDSSRTCGNVTDEVLYGHIDWGPAPGQSKFTYAFQCTPYYADGAIDPKATGPHELSAREARAAHVLYPIRSVGVVVRPGEAFPWVTRGASSTLPIAVLGAADLAVGDIDPATLVVDGAPAIAASSSDVNGDGIADLVGQFAVNAMKLPPLATEIQLAAVLKTSRASRRKRPHRRHPGARPVDPTSRWASTIRHHLRRSRRSRNHTAAPARRRRSARSCRCRRRWLSGSRDWPRRGPDRHRPNRR